MQSHIGQCEILVASQLKRLSHPASSPDLAPYDFRLSGTLKRKLQGCIFGDLVKVATAASTIFSKTPLDGFISVFDEWKRRLLKSIDRRGKCLESDSLPSLGLVRIVARKAQ
jgi:hypothetical protein